MECVPPAEAVRNSNSQVNFSALIVQAIVSPGSIVVILPCSLLTVWLYKFYCPAARVTRIMHKECTQNIIKHVSGSLRFDWLSLKVYSDSLAVIDSLSS